MTPQKLVPLYRLKDPDGSIHEAIGNEAMHATWKELERRYPDAECFEVVTPVEWLNEDDSRLKQTA